MCLNSLSTTNLNNFVNNQMKCQMKCQIASESVDWVKNYQVMSEFVKKY